MRFRFLFVSAVIWVLTAGTGYSQTITGMLDGYWSYNNNTPAFRLNSNRAFDIKDQSFSMNYGELAVDYKPAEVGVRIDIGFGDAADIVHRNPADNQIWRHIQQAYVSGTKDKFTVDFGKWVTPIGAEVIETKDDWNYTRGLLFTFAIPRYHFGARGTLAASDKATVTGYVVNGWDNVRDNNTAKSVGFTGILKPIANLRLTGNVLVGKESTTLFVSGNDNPGDGYRQLFDGMMTYKPLERLSLMANYTYTRDKSSGPGVFWEGVAVYAKAKAIDKLTVASRYEWFGDRHNAFRTGNSQNLQSFTATSQIPWSELTLWGEYRRDWSNIATFNKTVGIDSSVVDNQNTFTVGVTYAVTKTRE
jgi:hypothetical protein